MISWLTPQLQLEIKATFEPLYQKKLNKKEVEEIALNLCTVMEAIAIKENEKEYKEKYPRVL
jgi:hypothetical protein